ncbi:CPBP family intramembrane glutamic endopeptidase [Dyella sp. 20L07]|uniref:CPBP family intramembrane glutamic endopeptidase n=1 Tax=Dyella sp. 20L07 TaxID=3384240 RepID=UPI003D2E8756
MNALVCQVLLLAAIAGVLGLPAWRQSSKRIWLWLAMLVVAIDQLMIGLPIVYPQLQPFHGAWNWGGKCLSLIASLIFAWLLIRSGRMNRSSLGLTWTQNPGTLRLIVRLVIPFLVIWALLLWFVFGVPTPATTETHAYELSMPGLTEELVYRGLLLGLWTRAFTDTAEPGLRLGYAGIASSVLFALAHGIGVTDAGQGLQLTLHWMPMALPLGSGVLLAICRQRSGSLLLPVAFHNALNELTVLVNLFKP